MNQQGRPSIRARGRWRSARGLATERRQDPFARDRGPRAPRDGRGWRPRCEGLPVSSATLRCRWNGKYAGCCCP